MEQNERIAIVETDQKRLKTDVQNLFQLIRDHMEHEEVRWDQIQHQLAEIIRVRAKDKGFIAGIIFAVSAIWGVIVLGLTFWFKTH